jgi:predicted nuclease with TOPRIM domain
MSEDLIKERLNNHEKRIETLESSTSDFKMVVYRLDILEKSVSTMNAKLDLALKKDNEDKSKKWDKLIDYIFYAVLGILLSYIAYKLGFKK